MFVRIPSLLLARRCAAGDMLLKRSVLDLDPSFVGGLKENRI